MKAISVEDEIGLGGESFFEVVVLNARSHFKRGATLHYFKAKLYGTFILGNRLRSW
jgi:hypothetical protein